MATVFDYLTIACFAGLVIAYFQFTQAGRSNLNAADDFGRRFLPSPMGNAGAGLPIFALILIVAGAGYAALVVQKGH